MTNSQPLLREADTVSELRARLQTRLEALQKRLAELEQKRQATAPANIVAGGDLSVIRPAELQHRRSR